jgi:hypothetical protein
MKTRLTLALLSLCLLLTFASVSPAQTPDEMPPALETVCDMETGAAYGLCTAYCEAMDCETDNPNASATACSKVRGKFQQTTGRDLPCEVNCPCADPAVSSVFAAVLSGATPVNTCSTAVGGSTGILINHVFIFADAFSIADSEGVWICGSFTPVAGIALPISPEQGQFCADLLEQAANSQNVTCQ